MYLSRAVTTVYRYIRVMSWVRIGGLIGGLIGGMTSHTKI